MDPAPSDRFVEVLGAHGASLMRLAAAYAPRPADREDLFQEICLAIWQALPRFRGECSLRTFVFRIGHNRGLTFRSRHQRPEASLDEVPEAASPRPRADEVVERQDQVARLLRAVRLLPLLLRETMVLSLEGLSVAEIATVLGISENNTAVRLSRARQALRERLAEPKER